MLRPVSSEMAAVDREVSGTEVSFEQAVEDGISPWPPPLTQWLLDRERGRDDEAWSGPLWVTQPRTRGALAACKGLEPFRVLLPFASRMNGEFVDVTEIAFLLMRAEIQDGLKGFGREEQLWQLKMRFAQELVDGADGEEEREVRLSTLLTMVEERGGKLSGKKEKLFRRAGAVSLLSGALGGLSSPTGAEGLIVSLTEQTKAAVEALQKSRKRDKPRSTIQISPKVTWPVLDDDSTDHKSVMDFCDQFESTVHLANDGQGMSDLEVLITLRACLRQHRLKSYDLLYKRGPSNGTVKSDPGKVYQEIKTKHQLFSETQEERGLQVLEARDQLSKGRLTAHQWETAWGKRLSEREAVGMTARETLLQYLKTVGPELSNEIRRDKRYRSDGLGAPLFGAVLPGRHGVVSEAEKVVGEGGKDALICETMGLVSMAINDGSRMRRGWWGQPEMRKRKRSGAVIRSSEPLALAIVGARAGLRAEGKELRRASLAVS
ncbi:unnamed protein product [Symbiodinium necroappetens]|uniref:Uncharacterized protein n=1 Tax=Symbiodinium necroappetens TaxID=1628268 RepID=A0A812V826_9DINO|nr:unnamed protein product [Symbiodinium necroappetens]